MSMNKTKRLTQISLLVAILIIQTFVPGIGYIPIGPLQATIIHITVIVGAILFGPQTGALLGLAWGTLRMVKALLMPDILSVVFINPLVSILPRVLVGWLSGLIFAFLEKRIKKQVAYILTGTCGALINTIGVLSAIYFIMADTYAHALGIPVETLQTTFLATIGTNGMLEAIVSGILTPLLVVPLARGLKR